MKPIKHPISTEAASALLTKIVPDGRLVSMVEGDGSYSNTTYVLHGQHADGATFRVVARRYATFGTYDRSAKARREYRTLELLHSRGLPVPQPLYLDDEGTLLGSPGIVTQYVEGTSVRETQGGFPEGLARVLATIHALPCASLEALLLDGNAEVLWFLQDGTLPHYMAAHPLGRRLWEAARQLASALPPGKASLVHVDYWTGNILWQGGTVSAVLDWEEAACGEAGIDVAYCQMDLHMAGHKEAAEAFLNAYERFTGEPVANLALWQLAAAARPMFDPDSWQIATSPYGERFTDFVEAALERAQLDRI